MPFRTTLILSALTLAVVAPAAIADMAGPDDYAAVTKREFGTASKEMNAIETDIEAAKPDQFPGYEDHLLAVIQAPDATMPGKQFACQMLRIVASPKSIPVVAKLLTDDQLSHVARYVLLPMRDPAAATALRTALGQTQGKLRIGIINSIGDRRDTSSLDALAALVNGTDDDTARAALNAMGKIGGAPAAAALDHTRAPDTVKTYWGLAYLQTARSLETGGDVSRSEQMFHSLLDGPYPSNVRAGALDGYALDEKEVAVPVIVKALASPDNLMRRAGITAVITAPGHAVTAAFARELPALDTDHKVLMLGMLASRGDAEGLTPTVNTLASDTNPDIRAAAIRALSRLGDTSSVPALAAALKDPATASDANESLIDLHTPGVVPSLIRQAAAGDPGIRASVIKVLYHRRETQALPTYRTALTDTNPGVRAAGLDALAALGTQEDMTTLSDMLLTDKDDGERGQISRTLVSVGGRLPNSENRTAPILADLPKAAPDVKVYLLTAASSLGGNQSLAAVRAALAEPGDVHTAALRGLGLWPDAAPLTDLQNAAKNDQNPTDRILALRGYIQMIHLARENPAQKTAAYTEAMNMAQRPEEKRLVLAGLADVHSQDALKMVEPYLDDETLKREAATAYESIAESLARREPAVAKEALQKVVDTTTDRGLRNKARNAINKIK